jgi:hypothetical protein
MAAPGLARQGACCGRAGAFSASHVPEPNALLVLRIVGFLVLITIGSSLVMYLLTRNRRYVTFAWQVLKYGMVMAAIVLAFIVFERVVLVI